MIRAPSRAAGWLVAVVTASAGGCSPSDAQLGATFARGVHLQALTALDRCVASLRALHRDAPAPDADGWDLVRDADAVANMRADWLEARSQYARAAPLVSDLWPDTHRALDGEYDDTADGRADPTPFDGTGFTGLRALERVLWSDYADAAARADEAATPGSEAPRTPRDAEEARAFRERLVMRAVDDVEAVRSALRATTVDASTGWRFVVGHARWQFSMGTLPGRHEQPARYSDRSYVLLRASQSISVDVLRTLRPWLVLHGRSATADALAAGWTRLAEFARSQEASALPAFPADWEPAQPDRSVSDSVFGRWLAVTRAEADATRAGSLSAALRDSAETLGLARP